MLCCLLLLFQVSDQALCVASEAVLQFLILYFQLSVLLHDLVDAPLQVIVSVQHLFEILPGSLIFSPFGSLSIDNLLVVRARLTQFFVKGIFLAQLIF